MPEFPFDPSKIAGLADETFRAPDLLGTVEGWRTWRVRMENPFGVAPKMYSVSHSDYFWAPRQKSQAHCGKDDQHVPGENCTCGFYSAKNLSHLMTMSYHHYDASTGWINVIGRLANWGKVVEGTQGWRAQFAYPVRLWLPFEAWRLAEPLSDAYGVPVELKNIYKEA